MVVCAGVGAGWLGGSAAAARIEVGRDASGATVLFEGEIALEDGAAFAQAVSSLTDATVALHSPGGNLLAGIRIGQLIRERGFRTLVADGSVCASACGLIWLAGARRLLQPTARIGFHAAYIVRRGRPREVGAGNALVGAYLSRLGLSDQAVVYMASAPPRGMRWLTARDARALGLELTVLPSGSIVALPVGPARLATEGAPEGPRPGRPEAAPTRRHGVFTPPAEALPGAAPVELVEAPLQPAAPALGPDARAMALAARYFAVWSDTNARALAAFARSYAPSVMFYGSVTDRAELLRRKQAFAERWPDRAYAVRGPSLTAECVAETGVCTVRGLVDWDARSAARAARTTGVARFELALDLSRDPPQIVAETATAAGAAGR